MNRKNKEDNANDNHTLIFLFSVIVISLFAAGAGEVAKADESPQFVESIVSQFDSEMVAIPGGTFRMGDLSGNGKSGERPVRSVTISSFNIGKYEVTFDQWDACVADGGCGGYRSYDRGWGLGKRPVIHISWDDVQSFIDWLNYRTGGNYRLPTEAEWEYAARAGSTTEYSWGDDIGSNRANCNGCGDIFAGAKKTAPVGSYSANAWGLHDMHGNVAEWIQDCWKHNYKNMSSDGRAWLFGTCRNRIIRGGSWASKPKYLRSAARYREKPSDRGYSDLGFRLAQDK